VVIVVGRRGVSVAATCKTLSLSIYIYIYIERGRDTNKTRPREEMDEEGSGVYAFHVALGETLCERFALCLEQDSR
jgi:hypothetical protein